MSGYSFELYELDPFEQQSSNKYSSNIFDLDSQNALDSNNDIHNPSKTQRKNFVDTVIYKNKKSKASKKIKYEFSDESSDDSFNLSMPKQRRSISKRKYKKRRAFLKILPVQHDVLPLKEQTFCLYGYLIIDADLKKSPLKLDNQDSLINSGYLQIHSLSLNKLTNSLDSIYINNKEGMSRFYFLIDCFKKSQNNQYKQLSNTLIQYYEYISKLQQNINNQRKALKMNRDQLDLMDEQVLSFYAQGSQYIADNYKENEVYTYTFYHSNYRTGCREIKAYGQSKAYIKLIQNKSIQEQLDISLMKQKNQKVNISSIKEDIFDQELSFKKIIKQINDLMLKRQDEPTQTLLLSQHGISYKALQYTEFVTGENYGLQQFQISDYTLEIQKYEISIPDLIKNVNQKITIQQQNIKQKIENIEYNQKLQNQIFNEILQQELNQQLQQNIEETSQPIQQTAENSESLYCLEYICQAEFLVEKYYNENI